MPLSFALENGQFNIIFISLKNSILKKYEDSLTKFSSQGLACGKVLDEGWVLNTVAVITQHTSSGLHRNLLFRM